MTADARPWFLDNARGRALPEAVAAHLRSLGPDAGIDIAAGFFTLPGFGLLADALPAKGKLRLLLGAELPPEADFEPDPPGAPPEPERTRRRVRAALERLNRGLARARDLLPFDAATEGQVRRLLDTLRAGRMECRRVESQFLPARAMLFRAKGGGAVTLSGNVSEAGLRGTPALALGHHGTPAEAPLGQWFDGLWKAAAPFDLAGLFARLSADHKPYLIFLRVLFQLYGDELGEETKASGGLPVTQFQQHGVWRALRIIRELGGVLIADGVGLGKTFTAGAILQHYAGQRRRVLIVCPAALRDGTWGPFLSRFQLFAECLSYEELARDEQLGGEGRHLNRPLDEYALVIVDEAHNYRNPNTRARAAVLRQLLAGQRRDLVMLSATPVNNSLWDLYHLLRYFLRQDSALASHGVLSLHEQFDEAMRQDPFSLNPDLLYPIIDATTVKRTRHFVRRHYANDLITLPDGRRVPVQFPRPVPSTISYGLDDVLPGFLPRLERALMPPDGNPELTMARYQPARYRADAEEEGETAIVGLLRSALLKRFESSVHAFAVTAEKMAREHDLFLQGLDAGRVLSRDQVRELSAADDEDVDEVLGDESAEPAAGYRVPALRSAVQADRALLLAMYEAADAVTPDRDPKLARLADELARIAKQAEEGIDEQDRRQKRKVLVFSYFADTIDWIEEYLKGRLEADPRLRAYRGRMASVAGTASRNEVNRRAAVEGFAPDTAGRAGARVEDRFDILLTTDVLAEGQNLQQCRNIINYDLPWNPMRLVQRHGRIDRIGSPHKEVFLRTYFPDRALDRLLALEQRVRRKLAQAAASVGVETAPIQDGHEADRAFSETREELERLRAGNPALYEAGGTAGAAQTGEEYRQQLRRALQRRGDEIRNLPWKAGSGLAKGRRRGHVFCAVIGGRTFLRFVPWTEGEAIERELGACLRLIECAEDTPRVVPADLLAGAYAAWERARRDIWEAWDHETDPANLQPRVQPILRQIADHLRRYPPDGVERAALEQSLEAIEAPCSRRDENALRAVFQEEHAGHKARSLAVVQAVASLGLEPFQAPQPLPPIGEDEVHLVCWMAVEVG